MYTLSTAKQFTEYTLHPNGDSNHHHYDGMLHISS
jgi:hypothetical protein